MKKRYGFITFALCGAFISLPTFSYYFEVHWIETWRVQHGRPYAVWTAKSAAEAGHVVIVNDNDVVDYAYLRPKSLYKNDSDIYNGNDLILPKNNLLLKMDGTIKNLYCTWNFGKNINNPDFYKKITVKYVTHYLCLVTDDQGISHDATVMAGIYGSLITVFREGSGLFGEKLKQLNSTALSVTDSDKYFRYTQQITRLTSSSGGMPCLVTGIGQNNTLDISSSPVCFSAVGASVRIGGGSYSFLGESEGKYRIGIDTPINQQNISPRIDP